jgi:Exoribonuclease R
MVEFMQDKVGNEFDGTISGLTEWGIYVEIEPTKIEGMISLRDVKDDYLVFDEENYRTVGKGTGRIFNLGDKVRIRVLRASLEQKLLDYELVWDALEDIPEEKPKKKPASTPKKKKSTKTDK